MIQYRCDGCGRSLDKTALRYTVNIDVRAAYNEVVIGLADLVRDHREEMVALVRQMEERDPAELEAQIYKRFQLDLCPRCQRNYLHDPLRFRPEGAAADAPPADIDAFLRSLGYGKPPEGS